MLSCVIISLVIITLITIAEKMTGYKRSFNDYVLLAMIILGTSFATKGYGNQPTSQLTTQFSIVEIKDQSKVL